MNIAELRDGLLPLKPIRLPLIRPPPPERRERFTNGSRREPFNRYPPESSPGTSF